MASFKKEFARWQANFGTGFAIVLPVFLSIAIVIWLFGSASNVTKELLFFLPWALEPHQIFENGQDGEIFWYWRLGALALAIFLLGLLGGIARLYFGKKLIQLMDRILLHVPLLNKIYGALKQINDAFTNNNKTTFKKVVVVEWPRKGVWSIGFYTGMEHPEISTRTGESIRSVFVPTTPNPTTGFLVLLPAKEVKELSMNVTDGVKYIMSLGSVAPEFSNLAKNPDALTDPTKDPQTIPAPPRDDDPEEPPQPLRANS